MGCTTDDNHSVGILLSRLVLVAVGHPLKLQLRSADSSVDATCPLLGHTRRSACPSDGALHAFQATSLSDSKHVDINVELLKASSCVWPPSLPPRSTLVYQIGQVQLVPAKIQRPCRPKHQGLNMDYRGLQLPFGMSPQRFW